MGYALTSKRQVTIPIQICKQLGIGPGREIEYAILGDGRVVIVPIPEKEFQSKWQLRNGVVKVY
jgi:bifunctional DNA-binding transcriptional regulator/antitoxin component of YhaV-PrlF toxin-antitoxin module